MNAAEIDQRNESMNLEHEYQQAKDIRGIFDFHHLRVTAGKVEGFTTTKDADV